LRQKLGENLHPISTPDLRGIEVTGASNAFQPWLVNKSLAITSQGKAQADMKPYQQ